MLVAPASGDPFFLGFAGGAHYPPSDERIDPLLAAQLRTTWSDGRPTSAVRESAGAVRRRFSKGIVPMDEIRSILGSL